MISNSFNFVWVLKGSFNKYGWNSDDVFQIGYSNLSKNKAVFK